MSSFDELLALDVAALGEKIRSRQMSPVELTEAYLDRIEETDAQLHAYITVTAERARR